MSGIKICEFCREYYLEWDEWGEEANCNCLGYQEHHFCHKSDCSNQKNGSEKYCSRHKDCCEYNDYCKNKKVSWERYCQYHTKKCGYCDKRGDGVPNYGYCSSHRCQYYSCNNPVRAENYCSNHVKECQLNYCSKRFNNSDNEYCSDHHGKCYTCRTEILRDENGGYCFYHKKACEWNCPNRIPGNERFCCDHKKECEFDNCNNRINNYSNHCPIHPREKQIEEYKKQRNQERDRTNDLRTQLRNVSDERDRRPNITNQQYNNLVQERNDLQDSLQVKQRQLNQVQDERDDYQNKWDISQEELEQKEEMVRRLTREVNTEREENAAHGEMLERRHKEQRTDDIRKFLKIQTKRKELKELKNNVKIKLEDKIQKSLIANLLTFQAQVTYLSEDTNSRLFSLNEKQLKKVKKNLGEKLTEEEINKLCQLQEEITKLEIELEKLQERFGLQAQLEVPVHH